MQHTVGSTARCRTGVSGARTAPSRSARTLHNARLALRDPAFTSSGIAHRQLICYSTAAVDAEEAAAGTGAQAAIDGAQSTEVATAPQRPARRRQQRRPYRKSGVDSGRNKNPDRPLEVHSASSIKACAYITVQHMQKHSSMQAVATEAGSFNLLLKSLALAQRSMLAEDKCIAMLDLQPTEAGGMSVSLALAGAQPLCIGSELRIRRNHNVATTARIIVGKVASSEPVYLSAAGQGAMEVALQAVARAQARLVQIGYRTAVLPAYEKAPNHPAVKAGGFDARPAPSPAADGSGDAAAGGLTRSSPENSAVGAVTLSVVLVEEPNPAPPPAPSPEPTWGRREAPATALAASDLEVSKRVGAATTMDDSEAASAGTVTLEVTERVQYDVLADQIRAELKQKGSVNLSVDPAACGASLRALYSAGRSFKAPARILCDLAPSSRDGTYLINVTTASSLPPTAATTPAAAPTEGQPDPLGPLRVAASSSPDKIADALRLRLRVDGSAAVQCAYGQSSQVAFAALVEARDRLQTVAGRDLGFTVEQCTVEFQDKPMRVSKLLVETWPL